LDFPLPLADLDDDLADFDDFDFAFRLVLLGL